MLQSKAVMEAKVAGPVWLAKCAGRESWDKFK